MTILEAIDYIIDTRPWSETRYVNRKWDGFYPSSSFDRTSVAIMYFEKEKLTLGTATGFAPKYIRKQVETIFTRKGVPIVD